MRYLLFITTTLLLLASCAGQKEQPKPSTSIDWKEELFGVGLYGESLDSLNYVWYSFDVHPNSIGQIEQYQDFRFRLPYSIEGDTISLDNHRILHHYFDSIRHLGIRKDIFNDSSLFVIARKDSMTYQLNKLSGHDLVPEQLFIQLSSQSVDPKFLHADIRLSIASLPSNFHLSTYRDSSFLIMDCYHCDSFPEKSTVNLDKEDRKFMWSYINTIIKKRNEGKASNIACTLGVGYDIELAYDSLIFRYDNLCLFEVVPNYLHFYFENTLDKSRLEPFTNPHDDFYLYIRERLHDYRNFPKGNDIIQKATVQEVVTGPPEEPIIIEDE